MAPSGEAPAGIPDLVALYGREFFREWGAMNEKYVDSARLIARVLHREFAPKRLADIGSGCGVYSRAFRDLGADVVSLDGVVPPSAFSFPMPVEIRDLRVPFENVWGHST